MEREWGRCSDPYSGNMSEAEKVQGVCKWFNTEKGYGFITVTGREKDIFFHAKQWNAASMQGLPVEGEALIFVVAQGPKGDFATNITRKNGVSNSK